MNTIKTLVLAILITFSSQLSANTDKPLNELKSVSQQIGKLLTDSEMTIYDDVTVMIKFKLDSNNKIIVLSNDSNNHEISKFIKTRLNLKKLSIDKKSNYRFYAIPIKFLSTVD